MDMQYLLEPQVQTPVESDVSEYIRLLHGNPNMSVMFNSNDGHG